MAARIVQGVYAAGTTVVGGGGGLAVRAATRKPTEEEEKAKAAAQSARNRRLKSLLTEDQSDVFISSSPSTLRFDVPGPSSSGGSSPYNLRPRSPKEPANLAKTILRPPAPAPIMCA
uniref:Uncharacterized protein n=1 Tax=Haptolina brevifila TaxID=156173 RepID=A0A7S2CMF3_9EUKA